MSRRPDVSVSTIILAAGLGRRLWPLTQHSPKSLIDLGDGSTLLSRQIDLLESQVGVSSITIVAGHLAHQIDDFVALRDNSDIQVRFNPFYDGFSALVSIWLCRDILLSGDFMVCNGDTLFAPDVYDCIFDHTTIEGAYLVVSMTTEGARVDEVRALVEGDRIISVGKQLQNGNARSAGMLVVVGAETRKRVAHVMDEMVRHPPNLKMDAPWHEWVNALTARGVPIRAIPVAESTWNEIDVHPDVDELWRNMTGRPLPQV